MNVLKSWCEVMEKVCSRSGTAALICKWGLTYMFQFEMFSTAQVLLLQGTGKMSFFAHGCFWYEEGKPMDRSSLWNKSSMDSRLFLNYNKKHSLCCFVYSLQNSKKVETNHDSCFMGESMEATKTCRNQSLVS